MDHDAVRFEMADPPVSGRVSVVVTAYNGQRWLKRAIESVLAQTYKNYEIIAVDDASRDGSPGILREYEHLHNFTSIFHKRNQGIPTTRNSGLRLASGEYIAFLEQDDEWFEEKLAFQVERLSANPSVGLHFVSAVWLTPDGRELVQRRAIEIPNGPQQAIVEALFLRNPITSASSVMIRRACLEQVGAFDEGLSGADDYDMWLRIAGAFGIEFSSRTLIRYRLHPDSYSWSKAREMLNDRLAIIKRTVRRHPFLEPLREARLASVWLASSLKVFEAGSTREALSMASHALRRDPGLMGIYPRMALMMLGPAGRWWLKRLKQRTRFQEYVRQQ